MTIILFLKNLIFLPIVQLVNYFFKKKNWLFLYKFGSTLGDNICVTSIINNINKKFNYRIYLFTGVPDIYKNNSKIFKVQKFTFWWTLFFKIMEGSHIIQLNTKTYPYKNLHEYLQKRENKNNRKHLIEYTGGEFFLKNQFKVIQNEVFFSEEEIKYLQKKFPFYKEKYAIINPNSKTSYSLVKSWGFQNYQAVVNSYKIKWIQVGLFEEKSLDGLFVNLNGKTSIRELLFIVKNSYFVLADEGSLNHIASCFQKTKSFVVMSGFTTPEHIIYPNTYAITREPQIDCAPCYLVKQKCHRVKKYCTEDIKIDYVLNFIINNLSDRKNIS
jgi:ADP-heptose:LPS heptosyltransferase